MSPAVGALSGALVAGALLLLRLWVQVKNAKIENLRVSLAASRAELAKARATMQRVEAERRRERVVADRREADHARRLRFFREQVDSCTDPELRGRIAVDALRELLAQDLDGIESESAADRTH